MSEKEQFTGNMNHIAKDVVFNGNISFQENLTVSGYLLGNIKSPSGQLDITKQGTLDGNIDVGIINNQGRIAGKITAQKTNLFQKSSCKADIITQEIMVERYAQLTGQISMPDDEQESSM